MDVKFIITAIHYKNSVIQGYRVSLDGRTMDITVSETVELLKQHKCFNAELQGNKIVGTRGNLNNLTVLNEKGRPNKQVFILIDILELKGGRLVHLMKADGSTLITTERKAINLIKKGKILNTKLVTRGGKVAISSIQGKIDRVNLFGKNINDREYKNIRVAENNTVIKLQYQMGGDVYADINGNRSIVSEFYDGGDVEEIHLCVYAKKVSEYSYRRYIVDYEYDKYNSLTEAGVSIDYEGEYFVMICGQLIAGYESEVMRKLANICV